MNPNLDERNFLNGYEKNYAQKKVNNQNNKIIEIPQNIATYFEKRKKIIPILDEKVINVQNLLNNHRNKKISCRILCQLYEKAYNQKINKTTINLILRNQLGSKFLKTSVKNNILFSTKIKEQAFFVIKIIIRQLKLWEK